MKKILSASAVVLIAGALFIISCSKNETSTTDINDQFAQAEMETVFEVVLQKVDDQINNEISMLEKYNYNPSSAKSDSVEPCNPVITVMNPPNSKFPKTITLDYGSGCTDKDGNFRAGKIIVHITGPYWEENSVRHAQLVDYLYNDLKIVGDRYEKNTGKNENGYVLFELKNHEKIWNTEGVLLVERDWMKKRTYNRGEDLTTKADDEIWVTGRATVTRNGKEVKKEITVPLYRKPTCQHFQSGIITTFIDKEKINELNYGEGECDNTATWTNKQGIVKEILLKSWVNYYSVKP